MSSKGQETTDLSLDRDWDLHQNVKSQEKKPSPQSSNLGTLSHNFIRVLKNQSSLFNGKFQQFLSQQYQCRGRGAWNSPVSPGTVTPALWAPKFLSHWSAKCHVLSEGNFSCDNWQRSHFITSQMWPQWQLPPYCSLLLQGSRKGQENWVPPLWRDSSSAGYSTEVGGGFALTKDILIIKVSEQISLRMDQQTFNKE